MQGPFCFRLLRLLSFRAILHTLAGRFDEKLSAIFSDVLPEEVETLFYVSDDGFFVGQLQTACSHEGNNEWLNLLLR